MYQKVGAASAKAFTGTSLVRLRYTEQGWPEKSGEWREMGDDFSQIGGVEGKLRGPGGPF